MILYYGRNGLEVKKKYKKNRWVKLSGIRGEWPYELPLGDKP